MAYDCNSGAIDDLEKAVTINNKVLIVVKCTYEMDVARGYEQAAIDFEILTNRTTWPVGERVKIAMQKFANLYNFSKNASYYDKFHSITTILDKVRDV